MDEERTQKSDHKEIQIENGSQEVDTEIVQPNDKIILTLSDGQRIFAELKKGEKIRIRRNKYSLCTLIGVQYGSVFQLNKGKFEKLSDINLTPSLEDFDLIGSGDVYNERKKDNRNMVDDNTSQNLSSQDIKDLKEKQTDGADIIKALAENSKTWKDKTEFSQQKWLKRKQNKYLPRLRVVKCTAATVCDTFFEKNNAKVCNLRADSLAQMLWYGDVAAGQRILCFDSCMGVVIAALAERMGGHGTVLAPYAGQQSHFIALKYLNLPEEWQDVVAPFPINEFSKLDKEPLPHEQAGYMTEEGKKAFEERLASYTEEERKRALERRKERVARSQRKPDRVKIRKWIKEGADSLIIATNMDPTAILLRLYQHLHSSCPFVVFCEYLEPLEKCFNTIQRKGIACKLVLAETWNREYQFLPGRSHPQMKMTSNGGYVLSGIKVMRSKPLNFEQPSWKKQKR